MKIGTKITAMAVGLVLATSLCIVGVAIYQKGVIREQVDAVISQEAMKEPAKVCQSVYLMCQAMYESVSQTVANNLKVADEVMAETGPITFSKETVTWKAVNQFTKQSHSIDLPKMLVGNQWLGHNLDISLSTPVVDKVKDLVGGTCTVFQRMNAEGDMLRVATNVQKLDGNRAIGTYIPHLNPDGSPNPVIQAVLNGQTFKGRAFVVNAWYITAYQPIWDARREQVVGVLYFGEKQESVDSLRKGIMNTVVGNAGYVFVLGGKGDQKGVYQVSRNGTKDGINVYDAQDAEGTYFVRSMIDKALNLQSAEGAIPVEFVRYDWQDQGDAQAQTRITALTYFAPWDWVIGATIYENDLLEGQNRVDKGLNSMMHWILLLAAVVVTAAAAGGYLLSKSISVPLRKTVAMITDLERGRLDSRLKLERKDEIGQIAVAMDGFADNLQGEILTAFQKLAEGDFTFEAQGLIARPLAKANDSLIEIMSQVQNVAEQIAEASSQVSDSSQTLSQGSTESAASLEQIGASITQLTSQTKLNSENADQASMLANGAREAAVQGGTLMTELVGAMDSIDRSSADISKINRVIDEIAFQTNLLALNAAVEAARAGQHGKGFAVVAEEVRNLAARSAKAARETAQLIEGASDKTRNGSELAAKTSNALQEIVTGATRAADLISEIAAASGEQSEGIGQVNQGLGQIDQVTQQNTATAEESAAAAEELAGQADQLRLMLARFRLDKSNSSQKPAPAITSSTTGNNTLQLSWKKES
jgi:methyl-accepting chemotaxis protein